MLRIPLSTASLMLCIASLADAQSSSEDRIATLLHRKFPKAEALSIRKTKTLGLWEAFVDGQIVYVDAKRQFFIAGSIYKVASMENMTDARLAQLRAVPFQELPVQLAVTRVQGNGRRKFALFEDPFCGYCRALEPELNGLTDYTAYIFIYPILGEGSVSTAAAAWCSADKLTTWQTSLTLKEPLPAPTDCGSALEKVVALGHRLGISGTPTILFEDGTRRDGFVKAKDLSTLLDKAAP